MCGADVNQLDSNGSTPLFYAVALGHSDCVRLLIKSGARLDHQDHKGRTAAHCGASKGQLETLKILEENGANLWIKNSRGDLPLHDAVKSGRIDLVKWLLDRDPKMINDVNFYGRSLIHIAAYNHNLEMCKFLANYDVDMNAVMKIRSQYLTPLDAALQNNSGDNEKIIKFLREKGAQSIAQIDKHLINYMGCEAIHGNCNLTDTESEEARNKPSRMDLQKKIGLNKTDLLEKKGSKNLIGGEEIRESTIFNEKKIEKTMLKSKIDSKEKLPNLFQNSERIDGVEKRAVSSKSSSSASLSSIPDSLIQSTKDKNQIKIGDKYKNVREFETKIDGKQPTYLKQAIITNVYLTTSNSQALPPIDRVDFEIDQTLDDSSLPLYYVKRVQPLRKIAPSVGVKKGKKIVNKTKKHSSKGVSVVVETHDVLKEIDGQTYDHQVFDEKENLDNIKFMRKDDDSPPKEEVIASTKENEVNEKSIIELDSLLDKESRKSEVNLHGSDVDDEDRNRNENLAIVDEKEESGARDSIELDSIEANETKLDMNENFEQSKEHYGDGERNIDENQFQNNRDDVESSITEREKEDDEKESNLYDGQLSMAETNIEMNDSERPDMINGEGDLKESQSGVDIDATRKEFDEYDESNTLKYSRARKESVTAKEQDLKPIESESNESEKKADTIESQRSESESEGKSTLVLLIKRENEPIEMTSSIVEITDSPKGSDKDDLDLEEKIADDASLTDRNELLKKLDSEISESDPNEYHHRSIARKLSIDKIDQQDSKIDLEKPDVTNEFEAVNGEVITSDDDAEDEEKLGDEKLQQTSKPIDDRHSETRENSSKSLLDRRERSLDWDSKTKLDDSDAEMSKIDGTEELKSSFETIIRRSSSARESLLGKIETNDQLDQYEEDAEHDVTGNQESKDMSDERNRDANMDSSSFNLMKGLKGKKKSYSNIKPKIDSYWSDDYHLKTGRNNHSYSLLEKHRRSNKYRGSNDHIATSSHDIYARIDPRFINQTVEKYIRKFYTERKLFEELYDLKRYQIRTGRTNEPQSVRRLVDRFRRETKTLGMKDFNGPYTYRAYEIFEDLPDLAKVESGLSSDELTDFVKRHSRSNHLETTSDASSQNSDSNEFSQMRNDHNERSYTESKGLENSLDYERKPLGLIVDYKYEYHKSQHRSKESSKEPELVDVIFENLYKRTGMNGLKMDEMAISRKTIEKKNNGTNTTNKDSKKSENLEDISSREFDAHIPVEIKEKVWPYFEHKDSTYSRCYVYGHRPSRQPRNIDMKLTRLARRKSPKKKRIPIVGKTRLDIPLDLIRKKWNLIKNEQKISNQNQADLDMVLWFELNKKWRPKLSIAEPY
ncbi:ankyrin repeat domain containing protein 16 [Sarcoptes scabiei]|uniref:Alpha-latrotoxin n=1 Tax=Sarcoptes scabiei TaxID=52283 RepID=A0A132A2E1_SARSC|nr:ankyrin repeat domain containing protein 16 [Sarcoptes scabiei]